MTHAYRRIVLASRPSGAISADNFRLESVISRELDAGEVLVKNHFLSVDPYMRMRMEDIRSYAPPQQLNETMIGATAGEVIESRHHDFAVGDQVVGMLGWAEMGVCDGAQLRKVDTSTVPLPAYLGAVGMPGMTGWYGLTQILQCKPGETVLVSAAAGAVGSVVGQLAKIRGCRAVGIAGGPDKCRHVVQDLGFDACIDYKRDDFGVQLKLATPDGIDGLFENVGGTVLDQSLRRMNAFGRIALCGLIAGYEGEPMPMTNIRYFLGMRLMMQGFIVTEHMDLWPQGLAELEKLVADNKLRYHETIAYGLDSAPQALMGLLKGKNVGKQLVKLS